MSIFNDSWNEVFRRYPILEGIDHDGYFDITADEIKAIREPRLMVKQDHRRDRPDVFASNGLNILPLNRGSYRIARMELFHDFETDWDNASDNVIVVPPSDVESIDFNHITSEAIAIKSIFCTNILQDFVEDDRLRDTVSGRMGSGMFQFSVDGLAEHGRNEIQVENAQIEIDAGYEGCDALYLLEAKCNLAQDFLVRQLYYPFRCWEQKVHKTVCPIFFIYSNGIYHLMEYAFDDPSCYNSIHCVKYKKYRIAEEERITEETLVEISRSVQMVGEPDVPFPQADSFERVMNLCNEMALRGESMTKEDIWHFFSFTDRQSDYYGNAGIYLGLLERGGKSCFRLSPVGRQLFCGNLSHVQRHKRIVALILAHGVLNDCFRARLHAGQDLEAAHYEAIMRRHTECNLTEQLYGRRSGTVKHWIHWIFNLANN